MFSWPPEWQVPGSTYGILGVGSSIPDKEHTFTSDLRYVPPACLGDRVLRNYLMDEHDIRGDMWLDCQ